jgi:hypothetical protein
LSETFVKSPEEKQADIDLANRLRERTVEWIAFDHLSMSDALIRAALEAVGELTEEHPLGLYDDPVRKVWDAYLIARQAPYS